MRVGVVGPCVEERALRDAVSFLFADVDVDKIVFLGDVGFLERALGRWSHALGVEGEPEFLARASELACDGSPDAIEALLAGDDLAARLGSVHAMPPPPARAIELIDDRVVLFVLDKSVLDEEDILNAQVIVYGHADEASLRRFGRRAFVTPGPASAGRVAVVEPGAEGVELSLYDLAGTPIARETVSAGPSKLVVVE